MNLGLFAGVIFGCIPSKNMNESIASKLYVNGKNRTKHNITVKPEFKKTAENLGMTLDPLTPEECDKHKKDSIEKAKRFYEMIK